MYNNHCCYISIQIEEWLFKLVDAGKIPASVIAQSESDEVKVEEGDSAAGSGGCGDSAGEAKADWLGKRR